MLSVRRLREGGPQVPLGGVQIAQRAMVESGERQSIGVSRLAEDPPANADHSIGGKDVGARHLVIERLCVLDVEQDAALEVVTHTMTALAEATLELALEQAQAEADEKAAAI